jgi:hypothetical protein
MAEKLQDYSEIISLLEDHEIGYHSSSHSVHPMIFEFADVESYKEAYEAAIIRETSHINPLNGRIEGKGGIFAVRSLCRDKEITAYRAPGLCWTPPHSEALRDMGLKFDFSTRMAPTPVFFKGLTFYPYPVLRDFQGRPSDYRVFVSSALRRKVTVIALHPSFFVNQSNWDSIYHEGNPRNLTSPRPRTNEEFKSIFHGFDLFLKRARHMERTGLIDVTTDLRGSKENLTVTRDKVEDIYAHSMRWPRLFFGYEPKFLRKHFYEFFSVPLSLDFAKSCGRE